MRPAWITVILVGTAMTSWSEGGPAPVEQANPPNAVQAQVPPPWYQPPPEFTEYARQGFHAGVQAAIHDYDGRRKPKVARNHDYRRPPVPRHFRRDYRHGFQRGYGDAMRHLKQTHGRHT